MAALMAEAADLDKCMKMHLNHANNQFSNISTLIHIIYSEYIPGNDL
jgi:hypothetical protein